jgi:hypothetical protein
MDVLIWIGLAAWIFGAVGFYLVTREVTKNWDTLTDAERRDFYKTRRQR